MLAVGGAHHRTNLSAISLREEHRVKVVNERNVDDVNSAVGISNKNSFSNRC
jgi:hypothetical protein